MLTLALVTLLAACGGGAAPSPEAPAAAEATPVAAAPSEAAPAAAADAACLDKADLADGAADKVIHKCANCGLGMDGAEAQASTYQGYAVHSCSDGCKAAFDANPSGTLARACTP
jgi:hypothetical protein